MVTRSPGEVSAQLRLGLLLDGEIKVGARKQRPGLSGSAHLYHGTRQPRHQDAFDGSAAKRYGAAVNLGVEPPPPGMARGDRGIAQASFHAGTSKRVQQLQPVAPANTPERR
jgi:hypothetical protein